VTETEPFWQVVFPKFLQREEAAISNEWKLSDRIVTCRIPRIYTHKLFHDELKKFHTSLLRAQTCLKSSHPKAPASRCKKWMQSICQSKQQLRFSHYFMERFLDIQNYIAEYSNGDCTLTLCMDHLVNTWEEIITDLRGNLFGKTAVEVCKMDILKQHMVLVDHFCKQSRWIMDNDHRNLCVDEMFNRDIFKTLIVDFESRFVGSFKHLVKFKEEDILTLKYMDASVHKYHVCDLMNDRFVHELSENRWMRCQPFVSIAKHPTFQTPKYVQMVFTALDYKVEDVIHAPLRYSEGQFLVGFKTDWDLEKTFPHLCRRSLKFLLGECAIDPNEFTSRDGHSLLYTFLTSPYSQHTLLFTSQLIKTYKAKFKPDEDASHALDRIPIFGTTPYIALMRKIEELTGRRLTYTRPPKLKSYYWQDLQEVEDYYKEIGLSW